MLIASTYIGFRQVQDRETETKSTESLYFVKNQSKRTDKRVKLQTDVINAKTFINSLLPQPRVCICNTEYYQFKRKKKFAQDDFPNSACIKSIGQVVLIFAKLGFGESRSSGKVIFPYV